MYSHSKGVFQMRTDDWVHKQTDRQEDSVDYRMEIAIRRFIIANLLGNPLLSVCLGLHGQGFDNFLLKRRQKS